MIEMDTRTYKAIKYMHNAQSSLSLTYVTLTVHSLPLLTIITGKLDIYLYVY